MDEPVDPLDMIGEEAPEAVTTEEAPESEDSQETKTEDAQPRDEAGRFTERADQPSDQVEEPSEEAPSTQPDTDGVQVAKPFSYSADGRAHEITGATIGEDGAVSIPSDQVPHAQQLLSAGRHHMEGWQQERQGFQQQVDAAKAEAEAATQRANALTEQFSQLASMDEVALQEWVEGFKSNWPSIQAKAEVAGAEAQRQADLERLKQYEAAEEIRTLGPQVEDALNGYLAREVDWRDGAVTNPLYAGLELQDMQAVFNRLIPNWQSSGLVLTDKEQPWAPGEQANINLPMMRRELEYAASLRRQQQKTEQKVAEAEKTNKAELEEPKAPPAVSTQTGPPPGEKTIPRFKPSGKPGSDPTEEVDDWFDSLTM